jgi:hypothetical protein
MIEHTQVLRIKKLKGCNIIANAARHNLREIQAERGADSHIDPSRTSQNIVVQGADNAADVSAQAVSMMEQSNVKRRKNEVLGLEVLISLPPSSGIAEQQFFNDAVEWTERYFEVPILSAVIHNDEEAPHCHVIMLPLFDGRMIGSGLMGNKQRLKAIQADFHAKVGQGYGLKRGEPVKRHSAAARAKVAEQIIKAMRNVLSSLPPSFWDAMRDTLTETPSALMSYFGIEYEKPKQPKQTFAGIMTKKFKPEKPIGNRKHSKPIGNDAEISNPKEQSLSCVGNAISSSLIQPADTTQSEDFQDMYVEREEDHSAGSWDSETGEYIRSPMKTKTRSAEVERVREVIQVMRR